jgi:hypothetical protein
MATLSMDVAERLWGTFEGDRPSLYDQYQEVRYDPGTGLSPERLEAEIEQWLAARACARERMLLARAGRGRPLEEGLAPHFRLPCRADGTFVESVGFARLLDEFYAARGWDLALGWPTAATLRALGLEEAEAEVEALRRSSNHA